MWSGKNYSATEIADGDPMGKCGIAKDGSQVFVNCLEDHPKSGKLAVRCVPCYDHWKQVSREMPLS
jgi:hypothetical protein